MMLRGAEGRGSQSRKGEIRGKGKGRMRGREYMVIVSFMNSGRSRLGSKLMIYRGRSAIKC